MNPQPRFHHRAFPRLMRVLLLLILSLQWTGALTASASSAGAPNLVLNTYTVSSPNGAISAIITHDTTAGTLTYRVTLSGAAVIDTSTLGLNTSLADFNNGLAFIARTDSAINQSYSLPGRKKTTYVDQANEMTLRFSKGGQEVQLLVRAYNDGFAYRYSLPGTGSINVNSENSFLNLPDSANGWAQTFNNANYEGTYPARANFNSGSFSMPLLGHVGSNWLLISESDIGGSYQSSHLDGGSGNNLKVAWFNATAIGGTRPFNTPWRLAMIGGLNTIVESNLVENLSIASQVADTSWIIPGRSAWSWRAGGNQSDYNTHTQYVDLAASMSWEYYLVDAGWSASWVPTLVTYAQARNVKILLWDSVGNNNTEAKIRANFSLWAGWGVKGVKIDYFDNDSQATMFIYDTIARVAAEYHLLVNYHGATKPNGWMRKWPNVLTQEGVAGAEQGSLSATHNLSLVFTRNALGPMDYTPVVYSFNGSNTTWAHQTAMAVMYSSYIQHYSDNPTQYTYSIAREFLRVVPASWDDTRLLEGSLDQYATIARRSGNDWYVGSMTATGVSRTASIPLSFLSTGVNYTAQIYRDGNANTQIYYQSQAVTNASTLSIPIRAGGGVAIRISTQPIPAPNGGLPGYVFCANEDGTCSFSGTTSVAYGGNGSFFYQTATNSIACNNATFGDPVPGLVKACYYQVTSGPTPTPTRTNTPGPTATPTSTPIPGSGVIFYQDINFSGAASGAKAPGDYPSLPADVPNDWMSSLKVPAGWIVEAYADGNFAGAVCTFAADTSWVGTACNDVMSSFKIKKPVAFYPLENNANDSSGSGNNGTLFNSPTFVAGHLGQAVNLNGTNQYVQIPRSIQDSFTITFWVKTTTTGGAGTQWWSGKGLVDGEVGGASNTNDFGVSLVGAQAAFGVGNPDTTIKSTSNLNDGAWHHVAVTRNSTTGAMVLYFGGVQQASVTGPTGTKNAPPNLRLGSLQTNNNFFAGQIDEVRLYNTTLTAAQVAAVAAQ